MMSSHSLIGLVQSFFTKSDVEADDPMMAMKLGSKQRQQLQIYFENLLLQGWEQWAVLQ